MVRIGPPVEGLTTSGKGATKTYFRGFFGPRSQLHRVNSLRLDDRSRIKTLLWGVNRFSRLQR
jgi:hypothetical protein